MATKNCPICDRFDARVSAVGPLNTTFDIACHSCGKFLLEEAAEYEITQAIQRARKARPVLMHAIRKMQQSDQPILTSRLVKQIIEERDIPTAREQADNILIWAGDNSAPGMAVPYEVSQLFPVIGAYQASALLDLVRNLDQEGFLDTEGAKLILKLKGWDRYWELKRGRSDSKKAFMAMPYGNPQIDGAFTEFKIEVKKTGFILNRLDELPRAGSIDD